MRSNWLIAVACSASLAMPFAHAQERPATPTPQQASAHRTLSPIGKAMAELLRQAASSSPMASQDGASNGSSGGIVAGDGSAHPAAAATSARPSAEVAVQPPL